MKKLMFYVMMCFVLNISSYSESYVTIDAGIFVKNMSVNQQTNLDKTDKVQNFANNLKFNFDNNAFKLNVLQEQNTFIIKNFPVAPTKFGNIILQPAKPSISPNTEWYAGTKDGIVRMKGPEITAYSGSIENQPNSTVFLNFSNGVLFGYVRNESGETFSISPDISSVNVDNSHILSSHDAAVDITKPENAFKCLTADNTTPNTSAEDYLKHNDEIQGASSKLLEVKLACDGTYSFYKLLGLDYNKAAAYMASVITQSSKIYQNNINVALNISIVLIWTDLNTDPYRNASDLSYKLYAMPNVWKNRTGDRSLVVLFSDLNDQPAGNVVAGISMGGQPFVGSLCSKNYGYCALGIRGNSTFPTMNYTWDVNVATHEIGHNFSAPHTHSCYFNPNIDTCVTQSQPFPVGDACQTGVPVPRPGTIMSYCHTTNATHSVELVFHPLEIQMMRTAAERSACVKEISVPTVSLLHPLGDSLYKSATICPIRWTSSQVNRISIKYSLDTGKTWQILANNITANDSIYNWTLPDVTAMKAMVSISDASNNTLTDKSLTPFSILKPTINILTPKGGDKFGKKESVKINWNNIWIDQVSIYFSSDGGTNWSLLSSNNISNSLDWIVPDILSSNCKIKMISSDNQVISITDAFAIGTPQATLLSPHGGDTVCVGSKIDVKWASDYIRNIYIEYSIDGGNTWKRITILPTSALTGTFSWTIPDRPSSSVKVRLVAKTDVNNYLDSSKSVFTIEKCAEDVTDVYSSVESGFKITSIVPNPFNKEAMLHFASNITLAGTIQVQLFDNNGNLVKELVSNQNIVQGNNVLSLKFNDVSQGHYLLLIRCGSNQTSYPVEIIR